jgi:hypothetical protein
MTVLEAEMLDRRGFLKKAAITGASLPLWSLTGHAGDVGTQERKSSATGGMLRVEDVLAREKLKCGGQFTEAVIPDTLDLAMRAQLSVNNLTHNVDPGTWYYVYQVINFGPGSPGPDPNSRTWDITPKNARALPWMRTMCGSNEGLDQEYGMMQAMLSHVSQDGLMYFPSDEYSRKGTAYPDVSGVLALACENHYALDGNPLWLDWIRLIASGLKRVAIRVDDRAYYPPESTVDPDGKWVWNLRGQATIPYDPPEEPYLEEQGLEGCVKFEQGYAMRALVRAQRYGGDEEARELLQLLTRFDLKPGMWENTTLQGYLGNEHGIFAGHFHGNTAALLSLLDVAEMEGNAWLKEFVREAYENAVRNGAARVGWYPGWIMPAKFGRDTFLSGLTESDGPGEMILLGVKLSDAGLGEYWDDIDAIVRNQLTEQQFCSVDAIREMAKGAPIAKHLEDFVGGFGIGSPSATKAEMYGCCSANGSIGLYYAWEGITRFSDGVATVNLFLNRASRWMDVDSYLPYEGKVELHNKEARMALVRIPNWVAREKVKSSVSDKAVDPPHSGRYLVFGDLQRGATIRLEFPNPERTDRYTISGTPYQVTFRGSTVVDIEPRAEEPMLRDWYNGIRMPLYQRSHFRTDKAPMHTVKRFIPANILALQ